MGRCAQAAAYDEGFFEMTTTSVQQMADRAAELMEEHLKVRGKGLADKLRRDGRLLPRKIRAQARYLAEAAEQAQHPHLRTRIDMARTTEAYDSLCRHLTTLNLWERRRIAALNVLGSVAFNLLLLAALFIAVLVWRGYL
jgi:hypothetical protein